MPSASSISRSGAGGAAVVRSAMRVNSAWLGILQDQFEKEPVHLRLGQRIGAFHFDGILRRQHHERIFQAVQLAADGDALFLHRFEQRRLGLRRRPIDLVGEHHVGKHRPALKLKNLCAPTDRRSACWCR